jgi:hypothetical protein
MVFTSKSLWKHLRRVPREILPSGFSKFELLTDHLAIFILSELPVSRKVVRDVMVEKQNATSYRTLLSKSIST